MAINIARRKFIAALGGTAFAWPFAARAQQAAKRLIGFLHSGSVTQMSPQVDAFQKGLSESGYVVGGNIAIEYRWADGHFDRLSALAADLVQRQVTVLVAGGGPATGLAAKTATSEIPILFVVGDDPVKYGLVASLNRPGGNITGATFFSTELVAKRLQLMRELVPAADGFALLVDPNYAESEFEVRELQAVGQQITVLKAGNASELDEVFAGLVQPRNKAIVVSTNPLFFIQRDQLAAPPNGIPPDPNTTVSILAQAALI